MSEIRENSREIITKELIQNGFLMEMQAAYIEKVCEAASESDHPALQARIKLPQTKAQEIAAEIVIQYLENKNMRRSVNSLLHESHQQFVRKYDNDWLKQETKSDSPEALLHELVETWKTLDTEISLRPSPEEGEALNRALGVQSTPGSTKSRDITLTTDMTIQNDTIQTGQGSSKPWALPPKKPIRGRNKHSFVNPSSVFEGNGHKTVTVLSGTVTTGTITPTSEDSWSTNPDQPPVVQKVVKKVKKVKKSKPRPEKMDVSVEVTLSLSEESTMHTGDSRHSTQDRTKSADKSSDRSYDKSADKSRDTNQATYTTTYQTANPTQTTSQRQNGNNFTSYTYTYETVTVPKPETTTKTGETIQSTDSFPRQFDQEKARKGTVSGTRSSSSSQSAKSSRSKHSSRSATNEGDSASSRHSSRHSTRDSDTSAKRRSNATGPATGPATGTESQRSGRRQEPPPSLPQPGSNTTSSSSQDTYHKMMKESPLGDILAMQDANGGIMPQSQPTQSSGTTQNVSLHVVSPNVSVKSKPDTQDTSSEMPDLDSSNLGEVRSDEEKFKSDSINDEKMASDKELWSRKH